MLISTSRKPRNYYKLRKHWVKYINPVLFLEIKCLNGFASHVLSFVLFAIQETRLKLIGNGAFCALKLWNG